MSGLLMLIVMFGVLWQIDASAWMWALYVISVLFGIAESA